MKYILDTNAVSALMKGDPTVVARLAEVARSDTFVPQPVLAEIAYGIARLPRSKRKDALEERFELVRAELQRADWSDEVSLRFGAIKATLEKKARPIEDVDAAIAAHALVVDAVLVTANLDDMERVPGLRVEDWSRTTRG